MFEVKTKGYIALNITFGLKLQKLQATLSFVRLSPITTQTGHLNYVEVNVHGWEGFELLGAFR